MEPPEEIGATPDKIAPSMIQEKSFVAASPVVAVSPATVGKNNGNTTAVESDTRDTNPAITAINGEINAVLEILPITPAR